MFRFSGSVNLAGFQLSLTSFHGCFWYFLFFLNSFSSSVCMISLPLRLCFTLGFILGYIVGYLNYAPLFLFLFSITIFSHH